ncbi:MAG: hypothetical protein AB7K24_29670 [Gemmataceae bacterium]
MTESDWQECEDPARLLRGLRKLGVVVPARKYRQFACACCRRVEALLNDVDRATLVELERQAQTCLRKDLLKLRRELRQVAYRPSESAAHACARLAVEVATAPKATEAAKCHLNAARAIGERDQPRPRTTPDLTLSVRWAPPISSEELVYQAHLLREIVGSPFRLVAVDPDWLRWHDRTVVKLAQVAHEEREIPSGLLDAARLAIVADALEEAGCTSTELLAHLRGPGPHVRGCWALDRLLGE